MTAALLGEWKEITRENFDEFMKEIGVSFLQRKICNSMKPTVKFEQNGDEWTLSTITTTINKNFKFKLNEKLDEETWDDRNVLTTMSLDGDKLVQTQQDNEDNIICVITYEITVEGHLKTVAKAGMVESVRKYEKEIV